MEVPVAHHLGAAQHICVERIRPVHILNRQSKVLKTEDTLPERCVVACCHSYYSFSTGFLGTDEICAASGRDRRAAYQPNEIASPQSIETHPLPFARATRWRSGRDQVRGALQCGILTRLLTGLGQSRRTDLRDAPGIPGPGSGTDVVVGEIGVSQAHSPAVAMIV